MTKKTCAKCKEDKDVSSFSKDRHRPDGLTTYCRACIAVYNKSYRSTEKAKRTRREREYKTKYGISVEDYEKLLQGQGNVCAICKAKEPGGTGLWHIDHCHSTGQVRGVLCHNCNRGLGFFNDDIERLRDAALYLEIGLS